MEKITKLYNNSTVDFLITKKERWFGMTPFEIFLFVAGMATMIVLPFILKAVPNGFDFSGNPFDKEVATRTAYGFWDVVLTAAAGLGIAGALMLSTRNKHAWIILLIEAVLYGANSFFAIGSYALGSINMFIVPVILIISHFFTWKGHTSNGELKTRKLNMRDGGIVIAGVLVLTGALGSMFIYGFGAGEPTDWIAWIDALMGSIMAIAFIMSALRFRETFSIFLISNVVKIVAWTVVIAQGGQGFETSLTLAWIYFLNAVFGLLIWRRSEKVELIKGK